MSLLDITEAQLASLPVKDQLQTKALLNIRQALFDILGSYPQDNVLPYFYALSRTTAKGNALTANQSVSDSIKVSADAAFIAVSLTGTSTGDYLNFMRTDSGDRQLMNIGINNVALVGTAQRPGYLAKPLLLAPNTTISFDLTDLSGATNEIYFTMVGFKVYNRRIV